MITHKDILYTALGLTALALGSVAMYENQILRGELDAEIARGTQDVAGVKSFCVAEDMQWLQLVNETRERVDLPVINWGVAKER